MTGYGELLWRNSIKHFRVLIALLVMFACDYDVFADENPIELGKVEWQRNFDGALQKSRDSGKPVLLLFQEVPGCSGCKAFGAEVLSNPLIVEAIEDEFIPVVVYNNRKGVSDEKLLKRYNEPAWNYQVIRFLDASGTDVIPRKDRVWDIGGVTTRMIQALGAVKRPAPKYLEMLAMEHSTAKHAVAAFAMFCFWTGEYQLGKIDGVIHTQAGWFDGREVTRVVFDTTKLTLEQLAGKSAKVSCADKIYAPGNEAKALKGFSTGKLTSKYRIAKPSDQKRQIAKWKALQNVPNLTPMQLTKINALAPVDKKLALEWLSPRQRSVLEEN